jgi:hypothetical protein
MPVLAGGIGALLVLTFAAGGRWAWRTAQSIGNEPAREFFVKLTAAAAIFGCLLALNVVLGQTLLAEKTSAITAIR